jgi:hypothetical protein
MAGAVGKREALAGLDDRELALRAGQRHAHLPLLVDGERALGEFGENLVEPLRREGLEAVGLGPAARLVGRQQGDRAGDVAAEALEQAIVVGRRDPGRKRHLRPHVLLRQEVAEEGEAGTMWVGLGLQGKV